MNTNCVRSISGGGDALRPIDRRADVNGSDVQITPQVAGTAVGIALSAWLVPASIAVVWLARSVGGAAEANDAAASAH